MTAQTLERKLKPFERPVEGDLLKWLYLHLPPRPIYSRKSHQDYSQAVSILMLELEAGNLSVDNRRSIEQYLKAVVPFIEDYEKKEFPRKDVSPEKMLRFLMERNHLNQYDMAKYLGGQSVVSAILGGKRQLTRDQIERLGARFHLSPGAFFPAR